jgi:hypothetical protein
MRIPSKKRPKKNLQPGWGAQNSSSTNCGVRAESILRREEHSRAAPSGAILSRSSQGGAPRAAPLLRAISSSQGFSRRAIENACSWRSRRPQKIRCNSRQTAQPGSPPAPRLQLLPLENPCQQGPRFFALFGPEAPNRTICAPIPPAQRLQGTPFDRRSVRALPSAQASRPLAAGPAGVPAGCGLASRSLRARVTRTSVATHPRKVFREYTPRGATGSTLPWHRPPAPQ